MVNTKSTKIRMLVQIIAFLFYIKSNYMLYFGKEMIQNETELIIY